MSRNVPTSSLYDPCIMDLISPIIGLYIFINRQSFRPPYFLFHLFPILHFESGHTKRYSIKTFLNEFISWTENEIVYCVLCSMLDLWTDICRFGLVERNYKNFFVRNMFAFYKSIAITQKNIMDFLERLILWNRWWGLTLERWMYTK